LKRLLARLYSFKLIICLALLLLILLAYGLTFYSAKVYRDLATSNQIEVLQSVLASETENIIDGLYHNQRRFAHELHNQKPFALALAAGDTAAMTSWLEGSFRRQDTTSDQFQLKSLVVRKPNGDIFAHASHGLEFVGCQATINAIESPGIQLGSKNALCSSNELLFSDVLVPIGGLNSVAYLQVVGYAVERLKLLEQLVDMPLKITNSSAEIVYRSADWSNRVQTSFLYPEYHLYDEDSALAVSFSGAFNQQAFLGRINHTENSFLIFTTIAVVSVLLLVVFLLYRAFLPMYKLRNSVGALLTGKYAAISEEKLPHELRDLVQAYNEMVEGLEFETINRRKIEEKLRSEKDFISTTLNSIPSPVIVIDSKHSIRLVNPIAALLFGEKQSTLINTSIHETLILYANRQITRIINISQLLNQNENLGTLFFYCPSRAILELEFSASPMIDLESEDVGFVIILKDVTEDRHLRRKLSYEGNHDQLTRFLNRAAFENRFENLVTEDHGLITPHALAYLDLDQFKVVNETCGSTAGDLLIKQIGAIIKSHVRKADIVARLGGDEFGIILPFLEIEQALLTIQEVIIEIQHTPFLWKGKEYEVGASVGVIAFGHMEDEYSDFYSKVTTACFLAKQNGGSQYHSIEENDQKVIAQQESRDWVSGIMKGLTEDSFKLYVQPIVPLDEAHNERHYEVLIRYQAEDGSIVSPNHFLPTAERYNLIEKIDRWVVNKTLEWLQANKASVDDTLFSINLSGRSIGSRTFHKFLQNRLEQSDVDTTSLCFEITETSVVDNIERSVEFINAIKKLGAKFSLDDFGTGLSSFSYLKQFPVDYLKIDGEFIRDIIEDDTSFVFVRSMSEVGHCLEMKVIAEYVESSDMFDKLRAANIDFIQGYTVGRPVDIQSLEILP
jgi:diguanylate cyclase (GGDEF)-like protein/PAS domain S-box-containing protein